MTNFDSSIAITASRARQRFPGHNVDAVYSVCWPVYRVRLTVTVLEQDALSTTAHYILKLANVGIGEPAELGEKLGLPDSYLVGAAAELLREGLVEQRPDLRLTTTEKGRHVLGNDGQAMRPQPKQMDVPFDPLTRKVPDVDVGYLLTQNEVHKEGLFVVQYLGDKPRLGDLRLDEIRVYNSHSSPDDRIEQEIIEVSEIRDRNARLQYRNDIIIAKLDSPNTDTPTFAAYHGLQYLEEETSTLRRLAESGVNLVPGEFQGDNTRSWHSMSSMSSDEVALLDSIEELDIAAVELQQAVVEADAAGDPTQSDSEREEYALRRVEFDRERGRLVEERAQGEVELNRRTEGAIRLVKTEEHHPLLLEAIDQATQELTLVSAWIDPYAFDREVCQKLARAVRRGVTVRIAWGLGAGGRRIDSRRNSKKGEDALSRLNQLIPNDGQERLIVTRTETHEKFIICDDRFCVWGSFNWLSYRGEIDQGYRRETSTYSTRPDDIALWKGNAATLFR